MIRSSPYHPESQGKIERSHATWKLKIEYDCTHGDRNWVKNLQVYQDLYNSGFHSSLGISPYECYIGVKYGSNQNINQEDVNKKKAKAHERDVAATETTRQEEPFTEVCLFVCLWD